MGRVSGKIWTPRINAYKFVLKKFGKNVPVALYFSSKCFYDRIIGRSASQKF